MEQDNDRLRQEIQHIEEARAAHLHRILSEYGALRRGAFVIVHRKCGKPNCHCATGKGHPAKYLSIKEGGRTRMVFIPDSLAETVAEEAERYRKFRKSRAALAKLARQSLELIDRLERGLQTAQEISAKPGKKADNSTRASRTGG